jgi:hypothetical protein
MSSNARYCPFLNRADSRCGDAFSLDHLDCTFKYCFGRYTSCPVYAELLIERKARRSAAEQHPEAEQHGDPQTSEIDEQHHNDDSDRVIQVTVHRGTVGRTLARRQQQPSQPRR